MLKPARDAAIRRFLADSGWGGADRHPLDNDASFRRYERLAAGGRTAMLMDAPPAHEDVRPFLRMARHLDGLGYSAPGILAEDTTAGLLIVEDLGDDTYTRLLDRGADAEDLYGRAVDVLADLHRRPRSQALPAGLAPYDDEALLAEAFLFADWYLPAITGRPTEAAVREDFGAAWLSVFPAVHGEPPTLVLRDYHVDNLMGLADRPGVAAVGLLDFQDAVAGCPAYDVVSLLEDARRDVDPALAWRMVARYRAANPDVDGDWLATACAILGAQRHAKVIGIFTRLGRRDGKPRYLAHLPRLWRMLERSLADPALAPVRRWMDRHVPPTLRAAPPTAVAAA